MDNYEQTQVITSVCWRRLKCDNQHLHGLNIFVITEQKIATLFAQVFKV